MSIFDIFFKKENKTKKNKKTYDIASHEKEIVAVKTYSDEDLVLSMDNFIKQLKIKMSEANINLDYLEYNVMSDKTYNFKYMGCQIGRMRITKKSSWMQILTLTNAKTADIKVKYIENKHSLDYYKNIDKWIKYTKYIIRSQKEYY